LNSAVVEDYIKAAFEIQRECGRVTTSQLAAKLGVTPASVTGMIKKLVELEFVSHVPYRGIELTEKGTRSALGVLRRHRLLELYLVKALGLPWDEVHREAEKLEHAVSEELAQRIDEYLEYPTTDPHGALIPGNNVVMDDQGWVRLTELKSGDAAVIAEVEDHDAEFLRHVGSMGLYPDTRIVVTATEQFDGLQTILVEGETYVLGRNVSKRICVKNVTKQKKSEAR
jgi:DtxR family Mn-dependent transcriptional regulator